MRFLCLPGYLQSGKVFAEKSSGVRKALTKKLGYELDYIDPPMVIPTAEQLPFSLGEGEEGEQRWKKVVDSNSNRCWWQHDSSSVNDKPYVGFEDSLKYVKDYIRDNGPYDGIFGFSQGAAMAAIVANQEPKMRLALLVLPFIFTNVRNEQDDRININYEVSDVQDYARRVNIVPGYEKYYNKNDSGLQVIVVYGKADMVVPSIRSKYLASLYTNVTEVEHEDGHFVPNKKHIVKELLELVGGRNNL